MTPRRLRSWIMPPIEVGLLVFAVGCAPDASKTTVETPTTTTETAAATDESPSTDRVRQVAKISLEIEREPGRASAILEANGMTAEEFEDVLYAIAQNAALTELYEGERSITPASAR